MTRRGITFLGYANSRAKLRKFGIYDRDRLSHVWCIGKTGVGKSTLLSHVAKQDLENDHGFVLLDPHGDLFEEVARHAKLIGREVAVLDPTKPTFSLDPFAGVPKKQRPLAVAGLIETFKKIWPDGWGQRSEHIFRNIFWTLLETPGATFLDVPRLLSDDAHRQAVVRKLTNPAVRDFWFSEFGRWSYGFRSVAIAPVQNKIGTILTDPRLRQLFSRSGEVLRLRQTMDAGQVLLVNLSKGVLGDGPSDLLGSILLSRLALAALSRADLPRDQRRPFWIIADEFQSFGTLHVAGMLGELRKYGTGFLIAHQQLSQLDSSVRDALAGNCGTIITLRLGADDAAYFGREFAPTFEVEDFLLLPNFGYYARLLISGEASKAFSGTITRSNINLSSEKNHVL